MKKVGRVIGGVLAAATMLTACGTTTSGTTASGETGKVEEITVMVYDRGDAANGTTIEDNAETQWIQEQVEAACGVKVNFQAVSRSTSDDNIQMMMAGGTAPDIIMTYDKTIFTSFAKDGGLADLSDAITNYGDNIQEYLGDILNVGYVEDGQFAVMAKREWQKGKHTAMIRKDWLDAMGMEVPTNKEELIDCLYAMKEQDPGNVGGNLIPWAMAGLMNTEKYYLNFVGSYVEPQTEEDQYVYAGWKKALDDGAVDGFRVLNQLYNDGIITPDFAVDTEATSYEQAISNGYVGFIVDDTGKPGDWFEICKQSQPECEWVAVNCFEDSEGNYTNPANPAYGAYLMVPAASEDKVDACVKYLNWLADPENAQDVALTPDVQFDEDGLPVYLTVDELHAKGYPGTLADFNLCNAYYPFYDDPHLCALSRRTDFPSADDEWLDQFYTVVTSNLYDDPVIPDALEAESTYSANVESLAIAYAYNLISCAPDQFDSVQQEKYKELEEAGLDEILEETRTYYNENVAK